MIPGSGHLLGEVSFESLLQNSPVIPLFDDFEPPSLNLVNIPIFSGLFRVVTFGCISFSLSYFFLAGPIGFQIFFSLV